MSIKSKDHKNSIEKEELKCPSAPKITKKPEKKKIPYINVIEDDDYSSSEEQKEKPIKKMPVFKKEIDDRYEDEDSFDSGSIADKETKSNSGNNKGCIKKLKEDNPESIQ